MTYDDLSRALVDPMTLTAYHLEDLLELSRQYPFCEALHRLLLIDLYRSEDVRFPAELQQRLIYLHDPFSLLLTLDAQSGGVRSHSFDLIERYIRSYRDEGELQPQVEAEETKHFTRTTKEREAQIVQDFLDEGPEAEKIRIVPESAEDEAVTLPSEEDTGTLPHEELYTEKLALMYAAQERYSEATAILKALSLKYPEKSGYFAGRMDQLDQRRRGVRSGD